MMVSGCGYKVRIKADEHWPHKLAYSESLCVVALRRVITGHKDA